MNEKELIKSNNKNVQKLTDMAMVIIAVICLYLGYNWIDYGDNHIAIVTFFVYTVFLLIYFRAREIELVVTDKRVYGKALWKQVDLPIDSISAVSKGILNSFSVATSSGRITWMFLDKREEVYKTVSNLLINRQEKAPKENVEEKKEIVSVTDEIKKYKELLDVGAITQEEFDAKKKQLLNL